MAGSKNRENGTSGISKKQAPSPARRAGEKKKKLSPEIDRYIQMKWGLALLGEEKAKAYLAWIQARLDAEAQ